MHISKSRRAAVRAILANSAEYDAATMQITRGGNVTARKDADKTQNPRDTARYIVAPIDELLNADGKTRGGF